jgi:hypothetical protein
MFSRHSNSAIGVIRMTLRSRIRPSDGTVKKARLAMRSGDGCDQTLRLFATIVWLVTELSNRSLPS